MTATTQAPGSRGRAPAPAPPSGPLWRNRDYAGWWISSLVSSFGSSMSQIAYPLLMLYATGSVARAGVVGACLNIGGLATTLPGGVLADRYSRRTLIVTCYLLQAIGTATVVFAVAHGYVDVVHIGAVALLQGMLNGISGAAMAPVLRRIVRPDQFPAMSAARQGRDMGASLIGPPIGGALFTVARFLPFLGDSISFAVAAAGVAAIRRPLGPDRAGVAVVADAIADGGAERVPGARAETVPAGGAAGSDPAAGAAAVPESAAGSTGSHSAPDSVPVAESASAPVPDPASVPASVSVPVSVSASTADTDADADADADAASAEPGGTRADAMAEIRAGVSFIRHHRFLRFAVPWAALVNTLATGLVLLVIALLKQRGAGPAAIGTITATAAVGGLLGAVCAPPLSRRLKGRTLVLTASWGVVAAAAGVAAAPKPWQIGAIGAALVFLVVPLTVVLETYELRVVPEALLGRVLSARQFSVSCLMWTSTVSAGVLADAFGIAHAVLVIAGCFAAIALWTTVSGAVRLLDEAPSAAEERLTGREAAPRRDNQATNNSDKELSFGANNRPREGE